MRAHWAIVDDPKINRPKVESVFDGEEQTICPTCKKEFTYNSSQTIHPIIEVVCCWECITDELVPPLPIEAAPEVKTRSKREPKPPKVKRFCPECSGPARGKGFIHTDGCSKKPVKPPSVKRPACSECGGSARGSGWSHAAECPVILRRKEEQVRKLELVPKLKIVKPPCPDCGGPARGRGFTHTADCPAKKVQYDFKAGKRGKYAKSYAKGVKLPCSVCGGPARGRGFTHKGECSARPQVPQKSNRKCPDCGGPARGRGFMHIEGCVRKIKLGDENER